MSEMDAKYFVDALIGDLGINAFFGVPDSLLRSFCDEIIEREDAGITHIIAADEGGACGLAAGHFLATGAPACVYMQNSGIGNAVNPICSLLDKHVYAIPVLFVVGWRGEPGIHDEPQHVFQGMCSEQLLKCVGLSVDVLEPDTSGNQLSQIFDRAKTRMEEGESVALLVRKGFLERKSKRSYPMGSGMTREEAVEAITSCLPANAAIVSTTGKLSRELFEIREMRNDGHETDFLTVGSMGHSSMIGLGIALAQPHRNVVVLDGDGAVLMHAGALAIVSEEKPSNYLHILINNKAHESVGGMPTASSVVDWCGLASSFGYSSVRSAEDVMGLREAILSFLSGNASGPLFVEAKTRSSSRSDLGRPTSSAYDNGRAFQAFLQDTCKSN